MKTKLNEIKTAEELITFIACFGIPTDQQSICEMQDIIGHSPIDEIVRLAKDDGLERRDGGTWSTGRRGTQRETMSLLFHIWNWEDAVRFYNSYVNGQMIEMKEDLDKTKKELETTKECLDTAVKKRREEHEAAERFEDRYHEAEAELDATRKQLEAAQEELIRLKARLFDMMESLPA